MAADVGAHDVVHVHVVAGLRPVAVDDRRGARDQMHCEDGDDTCLTVRILARTVDVGVAQGDELQAGLAAERPPVRLSAEFGCAVRRLRETCGGLRRRDDRGVAVDRTTARCEDDTPRARVDRGTQHVHGADHVHIRVVERIADRFAHIDLCGVVKDDLGFRVGDRRRE